MKIKTKEECAFKILQIETPFAQTFLFVASKIFDSDTLIFDFDTVDETPYIYTYVYTRNNST